MKASKCFFPGCPNAAEHRHHITYKPPETKDLCQTCHENITICNTNEAWRIGRKLSNAHRWTIWEDWLDGKITPVRTPEALAWISKWRRRGKKTKPLKVKPNWEVRREHITQRLFDTGLTHGEARMATNNARKYLIKNEDDSEAGIMAVLLLSDANFACGLKGKAAKICESNLKRAWPHFLICDLESPW